MEDGDLVFVFCGDGIVTHNMLYKPAHCSMTASRKVSRPRNPSTLLEMYHFSAPLEFGHLSGH
jgi:hypothetical protein